MGSNGKKVFLAVPAVIFCVDGALKRRIDKRMESDERRELCGGRIVLRKRYNEGAAFGMFKSRPEAVTAVQGVLLAAAAAGFSVLLKKKGRTGLKLSLGMLVGGGLSNFCDRIRTGHVIDYISIPSRCGCLSKLVFNLSDLFIFAGAGIGMLFGNRKKKG